MTEETASIFIQWKGTSVCLDFTCVCGADGHVDDEFVYALECPSCGVTWAMPCSEEPYFVPLKVRTRTDGADATKVAIG